MFIKIPINVYCLNEHSLRLLVLVLLRRCMQILCIPHLAEVLLTPVNMRHPSLISKRQGNVVSQNQVNQTVCLRHCENAWVREANLRKEEEENRKSSC